MARRKKSGFQAFIDGITVTGLLLHPGTLFVAFNVAIAITAIMCWDRYQDKILDHESLSLTADKIEVNAPPNWTKTDLKEAILESSGRPMSLLDPNLLSDAAATLKTVGWVEEVRRMEKSPEGLKVDLSYREPVALVELHGNTVSGWKKAAEQLIPVDRHGVVLPTASLVDDGSRPKIYLFHYGQKKGVMPDHLKHVYQWTQWPDNRVQGAAAIGELFKARWQQYGLCRITSRRAFEATNSASIPFELWTKSGKNAAIVIWGNPPGQEIAGEAMANEKLAAIDEYVRKNGMLDSLSERMIDLRGGRAIEVSPSSLGYRKGLDDAMTF